jgi:hypothetical protein
MLINKLNCPGLFYNIYISKAKKINYLLIFKYYIKVLSFSKINFTKQNTISNINFDHSEKLDHEFFEKLFFFFYLNRYRYIEKHLHQEQ